MELRVEGPSVRPGGRGKACLAATMPQQWEIVAKLIIHVKRKIVDCAQCTVSSGNHKEKEGIGVPRKVAKALNERRQEKMTQRKLSRNGFPVLRRCFFAAKHEKGGAPGIRQVAIIF